jgi:uncharacterized integral membrane protein
VVDQWAAPDAEPPSDERPGRDRRRDVRLVVTGVALVLLVWFAAANFQDVQIHFWVTTKAAPLIVVVAISGFLGASAAGLWSRLRRRRRSADATRP